MRILISTLALGIALASTSAAQIVVTQDAPQAGQDKAQDAKQEASPEALNVFYKAFWLERGARKLDDAVSHYKKFLAMAPKSEHAPRAARSLVNLLYRDDKVEDAQAAEKQFAALLAQAPAGPAGGPGAGAGGRGAGRPEGAPPRGAGQGGQRPGRDMSATIERLEKQIADAKAAGDDDTVEKLQRRLENVKAAAERGAGEGGAGEGGQGRRGAGGAGGGRMGGRQMKPLNEMTKEEASQWIERMEGFLDRMLERMPEDRAAEMEKGFKEMKSLVEAGKLEEAEKIRAKVMTFGRRRN